MVKYPKVFQCDNGSEIKSNVRKFLQSMDAQELLDPEKVLVI